MYIIKKSAFIRAVAFFLVLITLLPMGVCAASTEVVQPRASYYLDAYSAYVYIAGGGEVRVYFDVEGTGTMDEIGALNIEIWESTDNNTWTWKKSFTHDTTAGMLSNNDDFHSSSVSYNGVAGRYYKAYVCIWAGKNGAGDTRYFWTSAKR